MEWSDNAVTKLLFFGLAKDRRRMQCGGKGMERPKTQFAIIRDEQFFAE
jgi:hypothetical protein